MSNLKFSHYRFTTKTSLDINDPTLLESINSIHSDDIQPNDNKTESILNRIRNMDSSVATNELNMNAFSFISNYYFKKLDDAQLDHIGTKDMEYSYTLLQHIIDKSKTEEEMILPFICKLQCAVCLHDTDTFKEIFDNLIEMKSKLNKDEIAELCHNTAFFGYWSELSKLIQIAAEKKAFSNDDLFVIERLLTTIDVEHICHGYGLHEQPFDCNTKQYSKEFEIRGMSTRLRSIQCESEEYKNSILEQMKYDNTGKSIDPYNVWQGWIVENGFVKKHGAICHVKTIKDGGILSGPWMDDKIVVIRARGKQSMEGNEEGKEEENVYEREELYLEPHDDREWHGVYRFSHDTYKEGKLMDTSTKIAYDTVIEMDIN